MYILIFEDGSLKQASSVDEGDLYAADEGLLDIVDITKDMPRQYYGGEWHLLEDV